IYGHKTCQAAHAMNKPTGWVARGLFTNVSFDLGIETRHGQTRRGRLERFLLGRQRSISPMTMSIEPTMAGTSAIRQPRQISLVTLRLQKLDERARTRNGTASLAGRPTT